MTLADKRYMTAGLIGNYKRLADKDYSEYNLGRFVVEGTYAGYKNTGSSEVYIDLNYTDWERIILIRMNLRIRRA